MHLDRGGDGSRSACAAIVPPTRKNETLLPLACTGVFIACWLDKGLGLVIGGFVPNPMEEVIEYWPTLPEALITFGVYGVGFLVLTILYKVGTAVKEEVTG